MNDENRKKALSAALSQIERQFGKGAVMKMNESAGPMPAISTGSLGLDMAQKVQVSPHFVYSWWPKHRRKV